MFHDWRLFAGVQAYLERGAHPEYVRECAGARGGLRSAAVFLEETVVSLLYSTVSPEDRL